MKVRAGLIALVSFAALIGAAPAQQPAPPQPPEGQERLAAVKQSLQSSMAALRQYEWIETTVFSLKGEPKSKKQNRCYYGADGKLQKVPVGDEPEGDDKKKRGVRGRIVENKKEDITESMQEAVGLVKQYVPPDPAKLQEAKEAGRVSVTPPDAQGQARLVVRDYLKAGDSLTFDLDAAANRIRGVSVSSYTDKAKHAVGLNVSFGTFADGTVYPATIVLDVKEEEINLKIENSGHRKPGS